MTSVRQRRSDERALGLLRAHGLEHVLPVPVEDVADRLGVVIRRQRFDAPDVSGLLLREHGQPAVVGVNSSNSIARQRFTIAHELGHFVLHEGKRLILDRAVRVNFRDAASGLATDAEEMEANAFAAGLLMPAGSLSAELARLIRGRPCSDDELVERLARRCKVSRPAMEFRLVNLGMLTPS